MEGTTVRRPTNGWSGADLSFRAGAATSRVTASIVAVTGGTPVATNLSVGTGQPTAFFALSGSDWKHSVRMQLMDEVCAWASGNLIR